jgi:hypothetical protein
MSSFFKKRNSVPKDLPIISPNVDPTITLFLAAFFRITNAYKIATPLSLG